MNTTWRIKALWAAGALLCLLPLAGCSVLTSYPATVEKAQNAFDRGDAAGAVALMEKLSPSDGDAALYLMEKGTFLRAAADYAAGNAAWLEALRIFREFDDRATISFRDSAAFAASLLLNDKAIPYRGTFYERVLLNTFLAANFLMQGNLENARVMVMQADQRQRAAREEYEKEITKSREETQKKNLNADEITARLRNGYDDQRAFVEKAGNIYQNAFMFYLSAIIFEMTGEVDNAYILARRVHEQNPAFLPVRADLLRYAKQLGRHDEYERWRSAFGPDVPDAIPAGQGRIVLLLACGNGPVKEEIKVFFTLPLGANRPPAHVTIAVPKYRMRPNPVASARLMIGDNPAGVTQPLMDIEATAVKELWDRALGMAFRQILRATGRVLAGGAAREKGGMSVIWPPWLQVLSWSRPICARGSVFRATCRRCGPQPRRGSILCASTCFRPAASSSGRCRWVRWR